MKKGLAALAAACFLFVGTGKAQAVLGIPDDVPANTLLFPFFKVNPNRPTGGTLDTLLVITNTGNVGSDGAIGKNLTVHISIWTVRSEHVFDFNITLTPHDVFSCSLYDILFTTTCTDLPNQTPPIVAERLEVQGGALLAGYITADVVTAFTQKLPQDPFYEFGNHNVLIGHEYIVDLPNGSATGLNAVSVEDTIPLFGHPVDPFYAGLAGFYSAADSLERFSGFQGDLAQTTTANSDELDLIVRYFTASALNGRTEVWLWKECNNVTGSSAPDLENDGDNTECHNSSTLNVSVWDEAEHSFSLTLNFPDEVNFVDLRDYVSSSINGGWIRLPVDPEVQATAYSLQFANSQDATLRWDAVFPAHRQYTDYIGGDSEE
jgi:hypothetical protein